MGESLVGTKLGGRPSDDQLEVSLFGPGYGESIVVHLGHQEWMIVDSCVDPVPRRDPLQKPPVLDYLERIGIDPSTAVKLVVATHWHDDHIAGLASIVKECKAAEFVLSQALQPRELRTLAIALEARPMEKQLTSGLREFYQILRILSERTDAPGEGPRQHGFAASHRLIWQPPPRAPADRIPCQVHALSPSDAEITLALKDFQELKPHAGEPKGRIVARGPNHAAVVLWVKVGTLVALLGSDLEETKYPGTGWTAIVSSHKRPSGRAAVFKVAHHGSSNAHHDGVWEQMLVSEPVAILTPFINGNATLPKDTDIDRICARTGRAYATAAARPKRNAEVTQLLSKTLPGGGVRSIRQIQGPSGIIRFRACARGSSSAEPEIKFFGSADRLCKTH